MFPNIEQQNQEIKALEPRKKAYKFSIGKSLYILVHPTGSKYWRFKYRLAGKEKNLAIGVYPEISIEEAIEARDDAKKLLKQTIDPIYHLKEEFQKKLDDQQDIEDRNSELNLSIANNGDVKIKKSGRSILITKEELNSLKSFLVTTKEEK
jgi:hypothetical protein